MNSRLYLRIYGTSIANNEWSENHTLYEFKEFMSYLEFKNISISRLYKFKEFNEFKNS